MKGKTRGEVEDPFVHSLTIHYDGGANVETIVEEEFPSAKSVRTPSFVQESPSRDIDSYY